MRINIPGTLAGHGGYADAITAWLLVFILRFGLLAVQFPLGNRLDSGFVKFGCESLLFGFRRRRGLRVLFFHNSISGYAVGALDVWSLFKQRPEDIQQGTYDVFTLNQDEQSFSDRRPF